MRLKALEVYDYWNANKDKISEEVKRRVIHEFLSKDSLFIYCDCSMSPNKRIMSVACSFVHDQVIVVNQKHICPPLDCLDKAIYGELASLMFALNFFRNYVSNTCTEICLYSDVSNIEDFLQNKVVFKKKSLKKLQSHMISLYEKTREDNKDLNVNISYLHTDQRQYNPFARSCHNAAKSMLKL